MHVIVNNFKYVQNWLFLPRFQTYPPNGWFLTMPSSLFGHFALKTSFFLKSFWTKKVKIDIKLDAKVKKGQFSKVVETSRLTCQKLRIDVKSCVLTWELSWCIHIFSNFDSSQDIFLLWFGHALWNTPLLPFFALYSVI